MYLRFESKADLSIIMPNGSARVESATHNESDELMMPLNRIHPTLVLICAALGSLFFAGCASTHYEPKDAEASFQPTESIEVFREAPSKRYKVIGTVSASSDTMNDTALLESLKKKAMSVGGQGLILLESTSERVESSDPAAGGGEFVTSRMQQRISGQAIRFR